MHSFCNDSTDPLLGASSQKALVCSKIAGNHSDRVFHFDVAEFSDSIGHRFLSARLSCLVDFLTHPPGSIGYERIYGLPKPGIETVRHIELGEQKIIFGTDPSLFHGPLRQRGIRVDPDA